MQAFFANFPNKLALNFPQNIVHQIFHEMSNILYIFRFSRFSSQWIFPQIFRSCTGSRFSRFSILRKVSADFPRQVFQIFRFTGSARFSAEKSTPVYSRVLKLWFYTVTTFVSHTVFRYSFKRSVTTFFLSSYSIS